MTGMMAAVPAIAPMGDKGGLVSADAFLALWVPKILASSAYRKDGLLIVTFDEADTDDATSCCGEVVGPNIDPSQKVFNEIEDFGPGITGLLYRLWTLTFSAGESLDYLN